jgi:hypothetical protein
MKPKDWKDAMHNEAEAVSDDNWAQDTKQAARLFGWREHMPGFLVALGCALMLSITFNLIYSFFDGKGVLTPSPANQVFVYYTFLTIFLIFIGAFLGRWNLSPIGIGAAFAFMPIIDPVVGLVTSRFQNQFSRLRYLGGNKFK